MSIFDTSKIYGVVNKALDFRSLRQDLISSNIANIDTPFYRPKDINFESMLAREARKVFTGVADDKILEMAKTSPLHENGPLNNLPKGTIFFRDGHLAKNDGNSVDLDVETSEMGKNSVMYQALVSAMKKHKGIFAYAVASSRNI